MDLRHFYPLAMIAASLACPASLLRAQSGWLPQDNITSLTTLNHLHRNSTPLGTVDASANDAVELTVFGEFDPINPEAANLNLRGSRQVTLQRMLSSARLSPTRNLQNLAGSGTYTSASPSRAPAAALSGTNVPLASHLPLEVPHRIEASREAMSARASDLRSPKTTADTVSGTSKSPPYADDYEKLLATIAVTNASGTTGPVQATQISPFEKLTDPFLDVWNDSLESFNKNQNFDKSQGMEQSCGVACSLRSSAQFEAIGSETPRSDHQAQRRYSHESRANHDTRAGTRDRMAESRQAIQSSGGPDL
jgi:hypothetical protein